MRGPGRLYVCATPIGNLEDITLRALRVLGEVDLIAAEDTRHTRKLLSHYQLHTPLTSYHEHNEAEKVLQLVAQMGAGRTIALVSDAGMPVLADPGARLVQAAREAAVPVHVVPGPSAPAAALAVSGMEGARFAFEGFLPRRRKERRAHLARLADDDRTLLFFEAPHRLLACLTDLQAELGDRWAVSARELTKVHEEVLAAPLSELLQHFRQVSPRGEFVLIVEGANRKLEPKAEPMAEDDLTEAVRAGMQAGLDKKEAIVRVAREQGIPRRQVYQAALDIPACGPVGERDGPRPR